MTPAELMQAILLAPVDLLWNGGIGTYVKASTETNADVGDKANDAIRVDGARAARARSSARAATSGCTQLGRIEAALRGVRINTDAIDNSAGVDTSDHEVNIKILLDQVVARRRPDRRSSATTLLAAMTDEVAAQVLRDNYEQNVAARQRRARRRTRCCHVHERLHPAARASAATSTARSSSCRPTREIDDAARAPGWA